MSAVEFALAIVVPPVCIFLNDGIGMVLVVNILLTLVGWIPGSIHAVWTLSEQAKRSNT